MEKLLTYRHCLYKDGKAVPPGKVRKPAKIMHIICLHSPGFEIKDEVDG